MTSFTPVVVEVIPNIMFSVKVKKAAESKGVSLRSANNLQQFEEVLDVNPSMIMVDVQSSLPWAEWIRRVDASRRGSMKIVAFGGHAEVDKKRLAIESGADQYIVRSEFETLLPALMDWAGTPHGDAPCLERLPPMAVQGVALFNEGKYFEQHERLEWAWKAEHRPVRELYRGMILVGVGCYQIQRGNAEGAEKQMHSGLQCLEPFRPSCQGVNVEKLHAQSRALLEDVRRVGVNGVGAISPSRFPRIEAVGL